MQHICIAAFLHGAPTLRPASSACSFTAYHSPATIAAYPSLIALDTLPRYPLTPISLPQPAWPPHANSQPTRAATPSVPGKWFKCPGDPRFDLAPAALCRVLCGRQSGHLWPGVVIRQWGSDETSAAHVLLTHFVRVHHAWDLR